MGDDMNDLLRSVNVLWQELVQTDGVFFLGHSGVMLELQSLE